MSKKLKQNKEVFNEIMTGKSLLQLYVELKGKYDKLIKSRGTIHEYDSNFAPAPTNKI